MNKKVITWTYFLCFGFTVFALILIWRLFDLQIVHGSAYLEKADSQYVEPRSNIFDRGSIFFKDKNGKKMSAATVRPKYSLVINPSVISKPIDLYNILNIVTEVDEESFFYKSKKVDDPHEVIKDNLTKEEAKEITGLNIKGVVIENNNERYYPANNLLAHTIGFVGYKDNILSGRYGLERFYDDILHRNDKKLHVSFFAEAFSNVTELFSDYDKNNREGDITLTIEPWVEIELEKELNLLMDKWKAESVGGIVINPKSGEIYAMGSLPDFDPNTYGETEDMSVFSNALIESVYEMGSIIKPITMAVGLDIGAVTADTTYNDSGVVLIDDARIMNYDGVGRGIVSMQEVLKQSLNTGVVFVQQKIGKKAFRDYLLSFGFGERTDIDLPNEVSGLVSNLNSKGNIEYATASFGQGIALTPMATVKALSVLGNGGTLITPHLVKEIDYSVGFNEEVQHRKGLTVIKKGTSEEITRMLVNVVDEALLEGTVKMGNYSIAAKTGTAQIADLENGGYFDDRFLHSFFGYFPAYDPEFLIFLYTIHPNEVRYASQTLTDPFMNLTKFLINYYDVAPDR